MGTKLIFTAEVNVFDRAALMRAATAHGRATGFGADYVPESLNVALQVLLDNGPDDLAPCDMGFEIEHSSVE